MKFLQRLARFSVLAGVVAGIGLCVAGSVSAQQPDGLADSVRNPVPLDMQAPPRMVTSAAYKEIDLLRRDGFSVALSATVSLRVLDKKGNVPRDLKADDFTLIVNKTARVARLQAPGETLVPVEPLVLLVFPPNDPVVHSIGVRQSVKYFSKQPVEHLPWKVGILDSDGKLTAFTNSRSQLLVNLDVVDKAVQPFQYSTGAGLPRRFRWQGPWLDKAEDAISMMQRFEGPKVVLAINPLAESIYGLNDQIFAHDGPEALVGIAEHIGAHIYIANVGGPDVEVPGGDASQGGGHAAQTGNLYARGNINRQLSSASSYFAYRTSLMMQTAQDTMGGFSNSLSDLAGYIHRDLDENYALSFDMTAADRDMGLPGVEVRLANRERKIAILDVMPVGAINEVHDQGMSKEVLAKVKAGTKSPVASMDFRITQRVDYFPIRGGFQPMLPMSCLVEWTGKGDSPKRLAVMETVEDTNLSTSVLDRQVEANWNGRHLTWERDGHLHPGHYLWRVVIHDEKGTVFASAEQKITVENPRGASLEASSLVVGKACRNLDASMGMRKRSPGSPVDTNQAHFVIDPMRAMDCRVKPDSAGRFESTDMLHALVRLYPETGKLQKNSPDKWTASFVLRGASGTIESQQDVPFTVDSGSGHLAYVEMPLDIETVRPGVHTLDVEMRGPGIKKELKASRSILIAGAP